MYHTLTGIYWKYAMEINESGQAQCLTQLTSLGSYHGIVQKST